MIELTALWLPIVLATVAIFIYSSMAWMMLPHHRPDYAKLEKEDEVMDFVRGLDLADGNYMFPCASSPEDMKSEEMQKKWNDGPRGTLSVMPNHSMGANIGKTFLVWAVSVFSIAYLATMGVTDQATPMLVFRFFATAGLLVYFVALVPGSIWYHSRIQGHLIDAIVHALVLGGLFAWLWPYAG